ncbi:hypothetical protein CRG98_034907 [Punica granatum]|uniref:Uncharacterized protein n=1 Tax=Punica granatum TaxID=22663 RepID=A0A2I0IM43_PUNGR|nr:hypothetical protein CRG98_034907 [Punica granatum]
MDIQLTRMDIEALVAGTVSIKQEARKDQKGLWDRESRRMIRVSELHGGVYNLRYIARAHEVNKVAAVRENDVWYKRLRHPSP